MRHILLIIIVVIISGCSQQQFSSGGSSGVKIQVAVVTVNDASLRLDPLVSSARVSVLSAGDNVEIIDRSRERFPVAGKFDYWYKVRLRSGIVGWMFGQNLKVFEGNENSGVARYAKELREAEAAKVRKELRGKWWSMSGEDVFTDYILSLRENGTYASLVKGSDKLTEGEFTVDSEKSVLKFDKGTAFGDSLNYIIRGDMYVLEYISDKKKIKFKRISSDPNFKGEFQAEEAGDKKKQSKQ